MRVAKAITLTDEERVTLTKWARGRSTPARLVQRAKIILAAADGAENKDIAAELGWGEDQIEGAAVAGYLHDVGKVGIADAIQGALGACFGRVITMDSPKAHPQGIDPASFAEIQRYTKYFWINNGPYNNLTARKFLMKATPAAFAAAVAGGGMSIMLASDLIIAAEGTQFNMAYSRIATSPDGGSSWFLPRLIGYQKAMELLLLAESVDATQMQMMGVVNRVVPLAELDTATAKLARELAAGPATAYAETKAMVNSSINQMLTEHLDAEALAFSRCAAQPDFAEGVTAFVDKRKAVFGARQS